MPKKAVSGNAPAATAKPPKDELAKAQTTGLSVDVDFGEDAGAGFENQTSADRQLPFLQVLQSNSPQVKDIENGGLDGARAGFLHNTATDEIYSGKTGVVVVPATTQHVYVEWKPRTAGGGFVGIHEAGSDVARQAAGQFGKVVLPNGNELQETFYIYGLLVEDTPEANPIGPIVIPFAATKIKSYKQVMTRLSSFMVTVGDRKVTPPLFANRIRLTTVMDKNEKGEFFKTMMDSWGDSLQSSLLGKNSQAYQLAKELRDSVTAGTVKAQTPQASEAGGDPPTGGHF